MIDFDMTDDSGGYSLLEGINLWTVKAIEVAQSKNTGDPMLKVKFRSGKNELDDIIMLGGKGRPIGREKMLALGLPETHKGQFDPQTFVGVRVWIATHTVTETGTDKSGAPKTYQRLKVDIAQLAHKGYQAEMSVPPGETLPDPDDDSPF